jgi:allantoinase
VFLPCAKTLDRLLRQQAHCRQLALLSWHRELLINEVVVETNLGGIVTGISEIHRVQPDPINRAQAHRTWFATGVEYATRQLKGAQRFACLADGIHLGMSGGIIVRRYAVDPGSDDLSVPDDDRSKGAAHSAAHVFRSQPNGELHEIILTLHLRSPQGCPNIRSMTQAFISSRVVTPPGVRPAAVVVDEGRIQSVRDPGDTPRGAVLHSFGDLVLLPGLVDSHVHVNEPGRTEWEGFATATRAAAAGGYTTLVDMPLNCLPETTTVAALEAKRAAAAGQCLVDWAPWGGLTGLNHAHLAPLAGAGVAGFKCFLVDPGIEGFAMIGKQELEAALPDLAATGLPLLVHAELAEHLFQGGDADDWMQYPTYLRSRPDEAELAAIRMLIQLCRKYSFPLHIVHLSTALALKDLTLARAEGLPVTVETCPHYLHFFAEGIPSGGTLYKCAPPIRSRANREALWQGLRDGVIDLIATDHSPCPPSMKQGNFRQAWGGIASLSVAISVIWTEMRERGLPLDHLARWMSAQPAKLAGLTERKGAIAAGCDADLVVFDPDAVFTLSAEDLQYRHLVSPYLGEKLHGKVQATFVRGVAVYQEGRVPSPFLDPPVGKEHRREARIKGYR